MTRKRRPAAAISITNASLLSGSSSRSGYLIVTTVNGVDGVDSTRIWLVTNRAVIGYVTLLIKLLSKRGAVEPHQTPNGCLKRKLWTKVGYGIMAE